MAFYMIRWGWNGPTGESTKERGVLRRFIGRPVELTGVLMSLFGNRLI